MSASSRVAPLMPACWTWTNVCQHRGNKLGARTERVLASSPSSTPTPPALGRDPCQWHPRGNIFSHDALWPYAHLKSRACTSNPTSSVLLWKGVSHPPNWRWGRNANWYEECWRQCLVPSWDNPGRYYMRSLWSWSQILRFCDQSLKSETLDSDPFWSSPFHCS